MCANDLRLSAAASHVRTLPPSRRPALTTLRLCHITSTGSGTSPNILRLNRLIMLPVKPESSAFGTRGAMVSSPARLPVRHVDTAGTPERDNHATSAERQ